MVRNVVGFVVACAVLLGPGTAAAAEVANGDFETGTLAGWQLHSATTAGNWFAYSGTAAPIKGRPLAGPVTAPPDGRFAAISDEILYDTPILYREITLAPGEAHELSLIAYYHSYAPIAVPEPDSLSVDSETLEGQQNQQFRIDVMRSGSPIESLDPADVLATVFATAPGDPTSLRPTFFSADLTPFAGTTVRLRIAVAVGVNIFNAGVDDVSIQSTAPAPPQSSAEPPAEPAPPPPLPPPAIAAPPASLTVGRLLRRRRHGEPAVLPVTVSGPGTLEVRGGRLVAPQRLRTETAGAVAVPIRPTAKGRRVLRRRRRLPIFLAVAFTPDSGIAEESRASLTLLRHDEDRSATD